MQMPNQVYVYGPDGDKEGWYYENEVPEGWVRQKPEEEEDNHKPPIEIVEPTDEERENPDYFSQAKELNNEEKLAEAQRLEAEGNIEEANAILDSIAKE